MPGALIAFIALLTALFLAAAPQGPPPQRSLQIPPISDPTRTAVLSGFVPPRALAKGAQSGSELSPQLRSVVWVISPASRRIEPLPDQVMVLGPDHFSPGTLAVTPGTRVDIRTTERGVRVVRGSGAVRIERRLTRDTSALPVILSRPGAIRLSANEPPSAAGAIVAIDSPFITVAGEDGSFRIVGLPPGRREVRVRLPDGSMLERTVDLRAGGETAVDWREKAPVTGAAVR